MSAGAALPLPPLHPSASIEQLVDLGGGLALIRRRQRLDLIALDDECRRLDALDGAWLHVHLLHDNHVLALCDTHCLLLFVQRTLRRLRVTRPLTAQLDWRGIAPANAVDVVCSLHASTDGKLITTWHCWLLSSRSGSVACPSAALLPLLIVRSGIGGRLFDCSVSDALKLRTSAAPFEMCVRDARPVADCVALMTGTSVVVFRPQLQPFVQQLRLTSVLQVLRAPAHGRLIGGLDDKTVSFAARGELHRFNPRPCGSTRSESDHLSVSAASCAIVSRRLVCTVSLAGVLSVISDGDALIAPVLCAAAWPGEAPHGVAACSLSGDRVAALIVSRCHARLVVFAATSAATALTVQDGVLPSMLPARAVLMASELLVAGGAVPALHRASFGVRQTTLTRGDTDLGTARLVSALTVQSSAASLVVVTHAHGSVHASQAFVLDANLMPTADEIALDEASVTVALVPCAAMMMLDAAALQVTADAVNQIGPRQWSPLWQRPSDVPRVDVVASCGTFLALGCGSTLLLCQLLDEIDAAPFRVLQRRDGEHAVAALAVLVVDGAVTVAVSHWIAHDVQLLDVDLRVVCACSKPLAERATSMLWLSSSALLLGCGDGTVHLLARDGMTIARSLSVGLTAVSLSNIGGEQVLAVCASPDRRNASDAVLFFGPDVEAMRLVGASAMRSVCALPGSESSFAWLSCDDGALVVSRVDRSEGGGPHWSTAPLRAEPLALVSLRGKPVVLHEAELVLLGSNAEPVHALAFESGVQGDDMVALDDSTLLVLMRPKALHWYVLRGDALAFAGSSALSSLGVLCRVSATVACVSQSAPPRLTFWDAKHRCVHVHRFDADAARIAVMDLLPVSDNLFCVLSFDRARICRTACDADGQFAVVLDVVLQTPTAVRISCASLLGDSLLHAFDFAGAVTVFDMASATRVPFRRDGFEVPSCDALPSMHTRTVCAGDRVICAWPVADCNAQIRARLWSACCGSDSGAVVMTASGQVKLMEEIV
jgi:hypothetical protein